MRVKKVLVDSNDKVTKALVDSNTDIKEAKVNLNKFSINKLIMLNLYLKIPKKFPNPLSDY